MASCSNCKELFKRILGEDLVIHSSDIVLYDGSNLGCITIAPNSTLNEVIKDIADYICALTIPAWSSEIGYNGVAVVNYTITGGTGLNAYFEGIDNEILIIKNLIPEYSSEILYDGVAPVNYTPTGGTGLNAYFEGIDAALGLALTSLNKLDFILEYVETGAAITAGGGSLDVDIAIGIYWTEGYRTETTIPETLTLTATMDNYIDISSTGVFTVSTVAIGNPAPPIVGQRLYKCTTNGVGVVSTTNLRNIYAFDGQDILTASLTEDKFPDDEISSAKLTILIAPGTTDLANVTVDLAGRVTTLTSDFNIVAPADQEVLVYDIATGKWINTSVYPGAFPPGTEDYTIRYDVAGDPQPTGFLLNNNSAIMIGTDQYPCKLNLQEKYDFGILLAIPDNVVATPAGGGGLGAGTYYYVVTSLVEEGGETLVSAEVDATVDGAATNLINISWDAVVGAFEYRVYKGVVAGVYTEYFVIAVPTVTYADDGSAGTPGVIPTTHTALVTTIKSETDSWLVGSNLGIGTSVPSTLLHIEGLAGFRYADTNEGVDKVLRSDANGVASWVDLTTIAPYDNPYEYDAGADTVTYIVNDFADHGYGIVGVNTNNALYSAILSGCSITIETTADWSFALGGAGHTIGAGSIFTWIGNGSTNDALSAGSFCVILNGDSCDLGIIGEPPIGSYNFIGVCNGGRIWGAVGHVPGSYNMVLNGNDIAVQAMNAGSYNAIISGYASYIQDSALNFNTILNGNTVIIEGGNYNVLLNGNGTGVYHGFTPSAGDFGVILNGVDIKIDSTGDYNVSLGGDTQLITDPSSYGLLLPGFHGVVDRHGVLIQSSGTISSREGNLQRGEMVLGGETIGNSTIELTHQASGGYFLIPYQTGARFVIEVMAMRTGGVEAGWNFGEAYSATFVGTVTHYDTTGAGAYAIQLVETIDTENEKHDTNMDPLASTLLVTIDATGGATANARLRIRVNGIADTNINWSAHISFVETRFVIT